jgi:hypothetical protein
MQVICVMVFITLLSVGKLRVLLMAPRVYVALQARHESIGHLRRCLGVSQFSQPL